MLAGSDLLIFTICAILFGYAISLGGEKSETGMKTIMKKEEELRKLKQQEAKRIFGEAIAEKNRREYDLIAQDDKREFIEQLIK